jgi:hypothetical protein
MRSKLRNLIEVWSDGGLTLRFTLTSGDVIEGHVREFDSDEVLIEPIVDGKPGTLTLLMLEHIVMATYTDRTADLDE